MTIPFFDYRKLYAVNKGPLDRIFSSIAERGSFILGDELRQLEKELSSLLDGHKVLGVANATDGLEILLSLGHINKGDEVILSSHTMLATASAVVSVGAIPVLAGVDSNGLICPIDVAAKITPRTKAIIPTQLNGMCCQMDKLSDLALQHGLHIFEDSAQALGSRFKGQAAGTFGVGGCFSFYPAKTLGCLGDGGAIVLTDTGDYEKAKKIRDHGRSESIEETMWGRNSRLDNLQAGFLLYFLEHYESTISHRRKIALIYEEALGSIPEIECPRKVRNEDYYDIFQNYEILVSQRDELKEHLKGCNIGTLIQWGGGVPLHSYKTLGFNDVPRTVEQYFKKCIMLPLNQFISEDEAAHVASCVINFYR